MDILENRYSMFSCQVRAKEEGAENIYRCNERQTAEGWCDESKNTLFTKCNKKMNITLFSIAD